jgi:hypothetical protein
MPGVDYVSPNEGIVGLWGPLQPLEPRCTLSGYGRRCLQLSSNNAASVLHVVDGGVKVPGFWSIAIGLRDHTANLQHPCNSLRKCQLSALRATMQQCIKVRGLYLAAVSRCFNTAVSPPEMM